MLSSKTKCTATEKTLNDPRSKCWQEVHRQMGGSNIQSKPQMFIAALPVVRAKVVEQLLFLSHSNASEYLR